MFNKNTKKESIDTCISNKKIYWVLDLEFYHFSQEYYIVRTYVSQISILLCSNVTHYYTLLNLLKKFMSFKKITIVPFGLLFYFIFVYNINRQNVCPRRVHDSKIRYRSV